MKFIKVKDQDGDYYIINFNNVIWIRNTRVGLSHAVTFHMNDQKRITAIMTFDSLRNLQKMMDIKELF